MADSVIGLMDSAYFVSKNQLLKWVNTMLQLDLTYIEDLGSGAIYCQLIDIFHKNVIPMNKINWRAKFQYQFVNNLKLFAKGLEKIGATRKSDVNKLAKAKYQDNLETIQWLKRYLEKTATPIQNYNALSRRGHQGFFSHHAQKNSFVHRPASRLIQSTSQSSLLNCTMKRQSLINQENPRNDKVQQVKRILGLKQSNDVKVFLIGEVVYGKKDSKALEQKQVYKNVEKQQIF